MIGIDIDMPDCCYHCWFSRDEDGWLTCGPTRSGVDKYIFEGRPEDCPLKEVKNGG